MIFQWHGKLSPIGIDIGRRFIKVAQVGRRAGTQTLIAHAILERPEDSAELDLEEAMRLREVLGRRGFHGNRLILAAPTAKLACETLDLPPRASGAPIDQIARTELSRTANFGQAAFEMGLWDLPARARANTGTSVMAIALREDDAEALLAPFDDAHLDVLAIDAPITALARACAAGRRGSAEILAMLDIGWESSSLVLGAGSMVLYQRRLPESGLGPLCREISSRFALTNEATELLISRQHDGPPSVSQQGPRWQWIMQRIEQFAWALATEVQASFSYVGNCYPDRPVEKLLMSGGGANLLGLCTAIKSKINLPTSAVSNEDLALGLGTSYESSIASRLAIAVGLAQREDGT